MKIPKEVKVAGSLYDIELREDDVHAGTCYYSRLIIRVDPSLNEQVKKQVFVHELLYAIFDEAGYEDQDEDMVNRLGKVLYQVLEDNQWT